MRTLLARLRRNEEGTTAVEFGLVALPFFALIAAIFEVGYVDFESEMLASAVNRAQRAMLTGQAQTSGAVTSTAQFVSTYLCPASGRVLPMNFDCTKLIVDVRPTTTFVGTDLTNDFYKSGTNEFCPGAAGQIVAIRVAYPLGAIFPLNLFSRYAGVVNDVPGSSGWYHILSARALFKEEAYAGSYTPPAGC